MLWKGLGTLRDSSSTDTWELVPCDGTITLVEPIASAYTAALSTAFISDTGGKYYTLPVWTTSDEFCPIESYKLEATSSSEISYLLCDGLTSDIGTYGGTRLSKNATDLAAC